MTTLRRGGSPGLHGTLAQRYSQKLQWMEQHDPAARATRHQRHQVVDEDTGRPVIERLMHNEFVQPRSKKPQQPPNIIARNKEMIRLMTRGGVWRGNSSVPRTEIDRYRRLKTLRDTYKGFPHPPASAPSTHRIRPAGPPKQERAGTSGSKGDAGNPPHSSSSQPPPPPPPPPPRAPYGGRETGSPRRGRGNSPRGKAADGKVDTLGVQGQNLWSKQGTTPLAGKRPASAPPASRPTVPATPPLLHNLEVIHQQSLDADTGEGPQEAQKSVEEGVRTKESNPPPGGKPPGRPASARSATAVSTPKTPASPTAARQRPASARSSREVRKSCNTVDSAAPELVASLFSRRPASARTPRSHQDEYTQTLSRPQSARSGTRMEATVTLGSRPQSARAAIHGGGTHGGGGGRSSSPMLSSTLRSRGRATGLLLSEGDFNTYESEYAGSFTPLQQRLSSSCRSLSQSWGGGGTQSSRCFGATHSWNRTPGTYCMYERTWKSTQKEV